MKMNCRCPYLVITLTILIFLCSCGPCGPYLFEKHYDPTQANIERALQQLKDKDADVRSYAVETLRELGAKEYAKDIAGLLKDENTDVRGDAVRALGKLGAKKYARDIAELLKDRNAWVRGNAVDTLGLLGANEYAKDIAGLLKDDDANVRDIAEGMLKKWGYDVEKLKEKK